jgi:hypothetical protein
MIRDLHIHCDIYETHAARGAREKQVYARGDVAELEEFIPKATIEILTPALKVNMNLWVLLQEGQ